MAPGDMVMSLDNVLCFNGMMIGTALCVFSANSFNQWLEVPFDAQMKRTCNRPLVRGAIRPVHALGMACAFGVTGTATLLAFTNPLTALLGFGNIALYAGVYTSMKRTSIANTWWGSIVGAIPPMMGWTAVTGTADPGAWLLGATLFFWQFPHFNALSWNLRGDYSRAGYRMMSVVDPALCKRVALRYSAAMIPLAIAFPYFDLCSWWVAIDGSILNAFLTYRAWQFHEEGSEQSARRLFFDTLWHLPAIMLLYWLHKKREGNGPWYPFSWGDAAKAEDGVTVATAAGSA
jgi:protoheme IX farnesyltransferase